MSSINVISIVNILSNFSNLIIGEESASSHSRIFIECKNNKGGDNWGPGGGGDDEEVGAAA